MSEFYVYEVDQLEQELHDIERLLKHGFITDEEAEIKSDKAFKSNQVMSNQHPNIIERFITDGNISTDSFDKSTIISSNEINKRILDKVCEMVEIGVYPCSNDGCGKVYYAANKVDCYFVMDKDQVSTAGFFICNYCEKGYCDDHHSAEMINCTLCGHLLD